MCKEWDERIEETKQAITQEVTEKITQEITEKKQFEFIQKAAKKLSIQEIAELFDFDVSYVQKVLNS